MVHRIKEALSNRQKQRLVDNARVPSAVLLPLYQKDGEFHILFIKRTDNVQSHKGQISFPGGACEKVDRSACDTALRECAEEVGLATGSVEVIGELDDFFTSTSGFIISPFVGVIPWPYPLQVDGTETEKIIEVPISALLAKDCLRIEAAGTYEGPVYTYQGNVIWGASARILHQFLGIWQGAIGNQS